MDKETIELISSLLRNVENYDKSRADSENVLKEYSELVNTLRIDNPIHQILNKQIHSNLVKDLVLNQLESTNSNINLQRDKKRIKYNSEIEIPDLEEIIPFSLWKNTPNTNNLFKVYTHKKNNLLNKSNNLNEPECGEEVNNNFNQKNNFSNNKSSTNSLNNFIKNNSNYSEKKEEDEGKYIQSNNYMCNSHNLKRKNNSTTSDYEDYTNSIYNINKKKKNANNYSNYNRNKNNRFNNKNNNIDEDEEEHIKEEQEELVSFKSAVNVLNKKVFKGNSSYNNSKDGYENSSSNNNNNEENKSVNGFKKFNPPYKLNNGSNNSSNNNLVNPSNKFGVGKKEEEKEKELDEKLKGFDKKLIELIESEILSFSPNVKWDDIAGLEFAKKTIKEIIIWPLLRPDIFHGIRRPPKGLLLFGPPGTGKTMIAKAIASESKSKFFNISASSLMSKWIGESEKLVRTLFALASFYQPSVVFIDEIDSILTARSENECEASRRLKTEFLVQLDGAGTNQDDRILIIGATNRPQEIDDAFIRRLAKRLYIPLPNIESRKQLVLNVTNKEKEKSKYDLSEDDVLTIVNKSKGYSGSDMMGVCREAAMMPIRNIEDIFNVQLDNLRSVNLPDFLEALKLVKPSVSEKTISHYVHWNREFGSFQFDDKEN